MRKMKRDIKRIGQVLDKIVEFWYKYPDLRFAQVISSIWPEEVPFYQEDEDLLHTLNILCSLDEKI